MSLSNAAAKGAAVTLVAQVLKFCLQMGSLIVLARLLTPADYGLITMVTAITGVALVIGDFGLSLAAIQAKSLSAGQKSNLFWLNSAIGLLSAVAVFLGAVPIAAFYGQPVLVDVARVLSVLFVLNGLSTQFKAELTRRMRFSQLAIVEISAQAAGLAVGVTTALVGWGFWALVAQQVAVAACTLLAGISLSRWWPGLPSRSTGKMGGLVKFGANTMGVQLVTYASNNVDSVAIGRVWGAAALGLYGRAFQLFTLPMQQLAAPLTRVALPVLSRIEDDELYYRYLLRAQLLLSYGPILAFGFSAALAVPGITFLFGSQWERAAPIFQLLAIGGVFQALSYVYYWIFLSKALTGVQLRYSLIGRAALVACVLIGLPFGPLGVAAGYSAGMGILWLLYSAFGVRRAEVSATPLIRVALRPLALAVIGFAVVHVFQLLWGSRMNPGIAVLTEAAILLVLLALSCVARSYRNDYATIRSTAALMKDR